MALQQMTFNIGALDDSLAGGKNYIAGQVYEVFNANETLATIFSDVAGTMPITQDGTNNVSNSDGEVEFYIDEGVYYFVTGGKRRDFTVQGELLVSIESAPNLLAAIERSQAFDGLTVLVEEHTTGKGGKAHWKYTTAGVVNGYDIVACTGVPTLTLELIPENPLNPRVLGVSDAIANIGGGETYAEIYGPNSLLMNFITANYDNIFIDLPIRCYGAITIRENQTIDNMNRQSGILGYHPTEDTLIDDTLDSPNTERLSTQNFVYKNGQLTNQVGTGSAIHATLLNANIENNLIAAYFGRGIQLHDAGYSVENYIQKNTFFACALAGIEGFGGYEDPTDQYILHNVFFSGEVGAQYSDYAIRLSNCSGSLFEGNHYYGGNRKEYVRITAADNTRFIGEYFEGNTPNVGTDDNARLVIIGGNPNSITFNGCTFWKGDGTKTDHDGDPSCLVKIQISDGNRYILSFSGNEFNLGSNSLPIFGFINGTKATTSNTEILLDKSNVIGGSYSVLKRLSGSSTVAGNIVTTDCERFYAYTASNVANYQDQIGGEVYSNTTSNATSFPILPSDTGWIQRKPLFISNISAVNSISFSAGGGNTVGGLNPVPPNTRVKIVADPEGASTYRIIKT